MTISVVGLARVGGIAMLSGLMSPAALAAADEPAWLIEARGREAQPIAVADVRSADGLFRARVPAKLVGKVGLDDGTYAMELDIGAGTPASCEVLAEPVDAAALLRETARLTFEVVAESQGKINGRAIEATDAGAFGEHPFLSAQWIYSAQENGETRLGAVKQIYSERGSRAVYCSHVELGYSASFRRVVQALVETLEAPGSATAAHFVEISTVRIGEQRIGFAAVRLSRDDEGDTRVGMSTSMLMPQPDGSVSSQDSIEVQWVDADGALINAAHVVSANGELETNLRLEQNDAGAWQVSGDFKGKKLQQTIDSADEPGHYLQQLRDRRSWLSTEQPAPGGVQRAFWTSLDPVRFTTWRAADARPLDGSRVATREAVGDLEFEMIVERDTGLATQATLEMGAVKMIIDRAQVRGSY